LPRSVRDSARQNCEEPFAIAQILECDRGAAGPQLVHRVITRRYANRYCPHCKCASHIVRCIADNHDLVWWNIDEPAHACSVQGKRHQRVSIRRVVAERAAAEVAPQIEVFQLDSCALLEVSGQKAKQDIVPNVELVEQLTDAGHHRLDPMARLFDLLAQVPQISVAELFEELAVQIPAEPRQRVVQDDPVGPAGMRNAVERTAVTHDFSARATHRTHSGAARQHERAIDVEQHELRHDGFRDLQSGAGGDMKHARAILAGAALALAGAVVIAQPLHRTYPETNTVHLASIAQPGGQATTQQARAEIKGDGITGTAELTERKSGTGTVVEVVITASGLKPGLHGVHLHAVGKCEAPFTSAGGHFDPGPAGNTDPDANHPFHMGDIPNLEVGQDGKGTLKAVTTRVTLSPGPLSLFDADGTAVIIHGNEDKGITGEPKSGVSGGPRLACGVITK
jgi:Cu-Zn family superoxide dismutase